MEANDLGNYPIDSSQSRHIFYESGGDVPDLVVSTVLLAPSICK